MSPVSAAKIAIWFYTNYLIFLSLNRKICIKVVFISCSYWLNSVTKWCIQFLAHWKYSKDINHHYYYIGTVRRPNLSGVKGLYREQFIHSINTYCELAMYQELFWTISMPSWKLYFSLRRKTINKQANIYTTGSDECYRKIQSGMREKVMTTKNGVYKGRTVW